MYYISDLCPCTPPRWEGAQSRNLTCFLGPRTDFIAKVLWSGIRTGDTPTASQWNRIQMNRSDLRTRASRCKIARCKNARSLKPPRWRLQNFSTAGAPLPTSYQPRRYEHLWYLLFYFIIYNLNHTSPPRVRCIALTLADGMADEQAQCC